MVNLDKGRKHALSSVSAHKKAADARIEESKKAQKRMADEAKKSVLKSVLDALEAGVPQSRIAIEGLGYNQTNGIRSYFGLPMAGNLIEELKKKYATIGLTEVEQELALAEAEVAAIRTEPLIYNGEPGDGYIRWIIERPDGTTFRFADDKQGLYWQGRKRAVLTEEEAELLKTKAPEDGRRMWMFNPFDPDWKPFQDED